MASQDSSNAGMQKIIKEVNGLHLPESAKGYFTELLKHMDARDQEWAKVVKMWERYQSHSKSFNKEMVGIMQNMQEIFMKDDVFLKHLYKERMEEFEATLKDDSA